MPKVSVEIPQELLDDLNRHVGDDKKFVNQSDAIRTAIRKMLDMMDEIDKRHGRVKESKKVRYCDIQRFRRYARHSSPS
jgi:Arc/MetJ-type ribon-helix-helix transcriptional regulator